jgi:hypothetical protein
VAWKQPYDSTVVILERITWTSRHLVRNLENLTAVLLSTTSSHATADFWLAGRAMSFGGFGS